MGWGFALALGLRGGRPNLGKGPSAARATSLTVEQPCAQQRSIARRVPVFAGLAGPLVGAVFGVPQDRLVTAVQTAARA